MTDGTSEAEDFGYAEHEHARPETGVSRFRARFLDHEREMIYRAFGGMLVSGLRLDEAAEVYATDPSRGAAVDPKEREKAALVADFFRTAEELRTSSQRRPDAVALIPEIDKAADRVFGYPFLSREELALLRCLPADGDAQIAETLFALAELLSATRAIQTARTGRGRPS